MNTLRLENINLHAPYKVWQDAENKSLYLFETDSGLKYDISFMPDNAFIRSGAYQFCVNVEDNGRSFRDTKLQQTIVAIVEEFFEANGENVMLYLCETGDGKQKFRNRLFLGWFNTYAHHELYEVRTAEGKMDGEENFAALFIRLTNPRYHDVIEEFEEITSILFD